MRIAFIIRQCRELDQPDQGNDAKDSQQISEGEAGRGNLTAIGRAKKTPCRPHKEPWFSAVDTPNRLLQQADFTAVQRKKRNSAMHLISPAGRIPGQPEG